MAYPIGQMGRMRCATPIASRSRNEFF